MAAATTDDLATRLRTALCEADEPLWLPGLSADLADSGWRRLGREVGLDRGSYSTARMLYRDPAGTRRVVASIDCRIATGAGRHSIPIELLPEDLAHRCAGPDLRFFDAEEVRSEGVAARIEEALDILGSVPTVLAAVATFVGALHLIDPRDDEVDVSFSDPGLPFSAFVSVPGPNACGGGLRVAEALLHEAMHLQLTLVESIVPLVNDIGATYFSPWRGEHRTAQGVLHALYVFRVIDDFLSAAPRKALRRRSLREHAQERRTTIQQQVGEVRDFRYCPALTLEGVAFVEHLLR